MANKNRTWPTSFAFLLLLLLLLPSSYGQQPTRLQVFVTSDKSKAKNIVDQLNGLGAGPGSIVEADGLYKVQTRPYSSLADANFAKQTIVGRGFSDAFAVADKSARAKDRDMVRSPFGETVPSVTSLASFNQEMFDFTVVKPKRTAKRATAKATPERATLKKAFGFASTKEEAPQALAALDQFINDFPDSDYVKDAKLSRGYRFVSAGDYPNALRAFAQVAEEYSDDAIAGEAKLRMGYLAIKMKDYAEALSLFNAIASEKVESEPDVRLESMLRTAALYHRGKDLDAADACYAVIENNTNDQALAAFAAVHRAGLTLEKAWNGKATFQEAREKCDLILANRLDAPQSIRATACLMALETLAYEKKFAEMRRREVQARAELQNTPEAGLGNYWIAKARLETGDAEGAAEILDSITSASEMTQTRFANVGVATQARRLAADAYKKLGNEKKAEQLLQQK